MSNEKQIFVNARAVERRTTGVERYTTEALRHLGERVLTVRPPRKMPSLMGHAWEQISLRSRIPKDALLWSPANTGPIGMERQVVTIHDTNPLDHPEWFQPAFSYWYRILIPGLVACARAIIVLSAYVKTSLIDRLQIPPEKVCVIPGGVDQSHFFPRDEKEQSMIRARYGLPINYILVVGTLQPRKNIRGLLSGWELIRRQYPEMGLVVIGGIGRQFKRVDLKPMPPGVYLLGYLPDRDLPALYSGANVYLSTSLDEGFGLTVLEAMACGTPVAASRSGALPELLDGSGLLFDAADPYEIAAVIDVLQNDRGLRMEMARRGIERARCFSWKDTANRIWDYLQANV